MEQRKTTLEGELAATPPPIVRLHPNLSAVYRDKVARLEEALDEEGTRTEAGELLRTLIDRIVLTPVEDGLKVELHGDLARILAFCEGTAHKGQLPGSWEPGSHLSEVSGA